MSKARSIEGSAGLWPLSSRFNFLIFYYVNSARRRPNVRKRYYGLVAAVCRDKRAISIINIPGPTIKRGYTRHSHGTGYSATLLLLFQVPPPFPDPTRANRKRNPSTHRGTPCAKEHARAQLPTRAARDDALLSRGGGALRAGHRAPCRAPPGRFELIAARFSNTIPRHYKRANARAMIAPAEASLAMLRRAP